MIRYKCLWEEENLEYSIKKYEEETMHLLAYKYECTCNAKNSFISYGTYKRKVNNGNKKECIRIKRVLCKKCGKTHSLIPPFIVPYERNTIVYIINYGIWFEDGEVSSADYELKRINRMFTIWKNLLNTINRKFTDNIDDTIDICLNKLGIFFMQIVKISPFIKNSCFY